jgi:ferredoxin-type protein NapH
MARSARVGADAVAAKGWLAAHRWLLLRRLSQLSILTLFLLGPLAGIWIVKGNLASSITLGVLPLTDPYVLLQSLTAGHVAATAALVGAAIVLVFYLLVGGRVYCSWVCPMNLVTDTARSLRDRLRLKAGTGYWRGTRYWVLVATLAVAFATGTVAWELLNPVSMLHRGIIFGIGLGWLLILVIFLTDLLVSRNGWCGRLCPVGAFYGLIGTVSLLRVRAAKREQCNDCMDCFAVCPEPQVIRPALKGAEKGMGPVILAGSCTNCGRCIDVCAQDVFRIGTRFGNKPRTPAPAAPGGASPRLTAAL